MVDIKERVLIKSFELPLTMAIDKSNEPMIGEFTENSLLEKAQDLVAKRTETWEIAAGRDAEEAENRIPTFEQSEIEVGNIMGKGGFFQGTRS